MTTRDLGGFSYSISFFFFFFFGGGVPFSMSKLSFRDKSRLKSGREPLRLISGREAERFMSGREVDLLMSGREAERRSSGRDAERLMSGRDAVRVKSGRESARRNASTLFDRGPMPRLLGPVFIIDILVARLAFPSNDFWRPIPLKVRPPAIPGRPERCRCNAPRDSSNDLALLLGESC